MRKFLIVAIVCAMAIALLAGSACAYSSYVNSTGKACTYCHVTPGGPLTDAGRYYRDNGTFPPAVPTAPTGLTAAATSSTQINLTWTDASSDETGFKVERASNSSGPFSVIATLGAGVASYSNTGLTASTTYYYRVCAYNTAGNSGYTSVASASTQAPPVTIPTAPTGLSAVATSSSQINLVWTDASSNETGFKIERGSSSTGPFTVIATLGSGATSYSNSGLTASTTYHYRVCAYNSAGNSGYSNVASVATQAQAPVLPNAPTGLTATAVSSSQINLTWADASSNETGFKVERGSSSTGPFTVVATLGAGITTYSNTGLTASTTYYYRVCAYNTAGDSGYTDVVSATTSSSEPPVSTVPTAPTNLTGTAISTSQINLKWSDTSSNEKGFKVERSTSESGPFTVIATLDAGVTTYNNTGLSASTKYYYRVCAYNDAGNSDYSNTASVAIQGRTLTAPTKLIAKVISSNRIYLQWKDNSLREQGFKIERSMSESGPFEIIAELDRGATRFADKDLDASTTYYYRVFAFNKAGNSSYSNIASATTKGTDRDDDDDDDDDDHDDDDDRDRRERDDD